jgi:hypothetical protein
MSSFMEEALSQKSRAFQSPVASYVPLWCSTRIGYFFPAVSTPTGADFVCGLSQASITSFPSNQTLPPSFFLSPPPQVSSQQQSTLAWRYQKQMGAIGNSEFQYILSVFLHFLIEQLVAIWLLSISLHSKFSETFRIIIAGPDARTLHHHKIQAGANPDNVGTVSTQSCV